jgi:hypothetical protein
MTPRVALRFTRGYLRQPLWGISMPDRRQIFARSMRDEDALEGIA